MPARSAIRAITDQATELVMSHADTSAVSDDMSLHHAALYVSDLEATRAFYSGVLGMSEIARPADFTFPGAYFKRGSAEVHVVVETTPDRTASLRPAWSDEELRTGYVVHFALKVSSLDALREIFTIKHITPVGGPRVRADGVEQIYVSDPDGYIVELMEFHDQASADRRRAELKESGEGVPVAPGPHGSPHR
jgi:catechol 2,3-dioxygenase-like lactoylglutathione lyase family enzyme